MHARKLYPLRDVRGLLVSPAQVRAWRGPAPAVRRVLVAFAGVCSLMACEQQSAGGSGQPAGEAAALSPQSAGSAAKPSASAGALPLRDRDPKLAKRLVKQEGALLIDVRRQDEWDSRHLPGAHHLPLGELQKRLSEVERLTRGDKSLPLVLYCRSGRRSGLAKQILLKAGYQRVANMGGIDDWPDG